MPVTFSGIPQIQYHLAQAADRKIRAAHFKDDPSAKGADALASRANGHLQAAVMDDQFEAFLADPDLTSQVPSFALQGRPERYSLHSYFTEKLPEGAQNFKDGMREFAHSFTTIINERYRGTEQAQRVLTQAGELLTRLGYQA